MSDRTERPGTAHPEEGSGRTVLHQTLAALESLDDRLALSVDGADGRAGPARWTHRMLLRQTYREARRLDGLGVGRGSVVSVMTGNHPRTFVLRWATNLLGGTANLLPDGFSGTGLSRVLETVRPDLLLTDRDRYALALAATGGTRTEAVDVESREPPSDDAPVAVRAGPDDVAAIQVTSGSTGVPKAVPRRMAPPTPSSVLDRWRDAVQLLCTPAAHVGGAVAMLALRAGGRVVLQSGFDAGRVLAAVERERVTVVVPLFPRHLVRLLDHPALPATDTSSLTDLRLGGAPVTAARIGEAVDRFGPVVSQVYGTIEATNIATISARELADPALRDKVGRAAPGVELSLRGPAGDEVGPDDTGEVWVRSPAVMPGYVDDPGRTAAVLRDGWLRTGDLGRLDRDGYLSLVGRVEDLVHSERARISPPDIEGVLTGHPGVVEAAVVGIRDADGIESAVAVVVPRDGCAPTGDELTAWVTEHRGPWFAPSAVHTVDRLPTVPGGGKVDRDALRRRYGGAAPAP